MKKYFASPKLARISLFAIIGIFAFFLFAFLIVPGNKILLIIATPFMILWIAIPTFLPIKNALSRFWVDEKGIHNRHTVIHWSEITSYEILSLEFKFKRGFKERKYPSLICFGEVNTGKSFRHQNLKKCILISLVPKHLDLLERYGKGKSPAVDTILKYYSDIVKKP